MLSRRPIVEPKLTCLQEEKGGLAWSVDIFQYLLGRVSEILDSIDVIAPRGHEGIAVIDAQVFEGGRAKVVAGYWYGHGAMFGTSAR